MPFAGDQPFWAHRLTKLGVAPPALSPTRVTTTDLARAISFVEQPSVIARATDLGRAMARDEGLTTGVMMIEKHLAGIAT